LQNELRDRDTLQEELLKEWVDVKWKCKQAKEKLELVEKQKVKYLTQEAAYKAEVQALELPTITKNEEYEKLKSRVDSLRQKSNQYNFAFVLLQITLLYLGHVLLTVCEFVHRKTNRGWGSSCDENNEW